MLIILSIAAALLYGLALDSYVAGDASMIAQMRRVDHLTRTPQPHAVRRVQDMRTGRTLTVRACIEARDTRTGRVTSLRPIT